MCVVCLGAIFVCVCLGLVRQELGSCSEICAVCVSLSVIFAGWLEFPCVPFSCLCVYVV